MSDDMNEDYDDDDAPCMRCGGSGLIIGCCDDLCHGQGWCIHGDNYICPECHDVDAAICELPSGAELRSSEKKNAS